MYGMLKNSIFGSNESTLYVGMAWMSIALIPLIM